MSERFSQSQENKMPFDLGNPTNFQNSENPPYDAYVEYIASQDAAFTKVDITDFLKEPEIDQELEALAGGFRVR
jgi:hypothetical protein